MSDLNLQKYNKKNIFSGDHYYYPITTFYSHCLDLNKHHKHFTFHKYFES